MTSKEDMLKAIESDVRYTRDMLGIERLSEPVRQAMLEVPRERFVPDGLKYAAFDNRPLPIGDGQTISQPYIVAIMTELLELSPEDRVLEVGTGSGYQAAVLSRVAGEVYSVEVIENLARQAMQRFEELGYDNIHVRIGDGHIGWPEEAPFDAIMVTAAAPYIPQALIAQLKPGGRLIAPVGDHFQQNLVLLTREEDGSTRSRTLLPVAFVPLTGRDHEEEATDD